MSDLALQYFNAFDSLELPDLEILSEKITSLIFKKKAKKDKSVEEGLAFFNSIKGSVKREIDAEKELSEGLEDGLQMKCADSENLDYIITRDEKNGWFYAIC